MEGSDIRSTEEGKKEGLPQRFEFSFVSVHFMTLAVFIQAVSCAHSGACRLNRLNRLKSDVRTFFSTFALVLRAFLHTIFLHFFQLVSFRLFPFGSRFPRCSNKTRSESLKLLKSCEHSFMVPIHLIQLSYSMPM